MKRFKPLKKPTLWFLLLFSFAGFLSSGYLTAEHYLGELPGCSIVGDCGLVATSKYAQIGPVPLALVGVGYFLMLLFFFLAYVDTKRSIFLNLIFVLTSCGFFVALALLWLQFFIIGAICLYCLISDISSIIIFLILLSNYNISEASFFLRSQKVEKL